ncbi:nucleotide pyrophosphohydrolase [bacterium]|nr:nucleotide pyrophosphohydrolase [bacterium]
MENSNLTFKEFQQFIRTNYYKKDAERGSAGCFMWLMEEIGELASALQHCSNPEKPASAEQTANLQEEFADVLGWLSTLANMHGVDLEAALRRKYLDREEIDRHKS